MTSIFFGSFIQSSLFWLQILSKIRDNAYQLDKIDVNQWISTTFCFKQSFIQIRVTFAKDCFSPMTHRGSKREKYVNVFALTPK
jgi:hypothetical protein